ncbi:MAG: glycoside hydrolase family 99-like domain-containing protein [Bacillota bacterium]
MRTFKHKRKKTLIKKKRHISKLKLRKLNRKKTLRVKKKGKLKKRLYVKKKKRLKRRKSQLREKMKTKVNLQDSPYDSEYQENIDFSNYQTDIKALAFYLPQFHTFPENDAWWGKGFTEWVNTRKAKPRFEGHYQPREPHPDIGYYDLSNVDTLREQAVLAKQHGIYGFCFYYYWFSGKRLMEKPVDLLLEHPEIDLPFCLCWANENWTRVWDGGSKDVIMKQPYHDHDKELFIDDIKKYIDDSRYIRINGKPIIIVYNPGELPNIADTFSRWRKRAKQVGIGPIIIWTCQTWSNNASKLNINSLIDAEVEFHMWHENLVISDLDLKGKEANIINYKQLVSNQYTEYNNNDKGNPPVYRTVIMGWDNAARRENNWTTYYAYSLKSFYEWLLFAIKEAREAFKPEERFIFINAWNEWAEGTYLEPDLKYGYANINTLSKGLFDLPFDYHIKVLPLTHNVR